MFKTIWAFNFYQESEFWMHASYIKYSEWSFVGDEGFDASSLFIDDEPAELLIAVLFAFE